MNRTIIATVTIIAVAAVAIFGLRTYTQATTAPSPVTVHDADVNWDKHINVADLGLVASKYGQAVPAGGRPVAEQNIDANGNIKVAQQGPLDVNIKRSGVIIPVAENLVFTVSGQAIGGYIDVSACLSIDVFIEASAPGGATVSVSRYDSLDGMNDSELAYSNAGPNRGIGASPVRWSYRDQWNGDYLTAAPYIRFVSTTYTTDTPVTMTVKLYCTA